LRGRNILPPVTKGDFLPVRKLLRRTCYGVPMERFSSLSEKEFAARARAARAYLGWTLDQACEKLGTSKGSLSRRENALVKIPRNDRFVMATVYCEASGLPEEFFTEESWKAITSHDMGDGTAIEPEDVSHLVGEPPSASELP
jgi:transcriptional regulator with XRE-family HTH domain